MSRRLRFGPDAPGDSIFVPHLDPRANVEITIVAVHNETAPVSIVFSADPHTPETHIPLLLVHVVAVPSGTARPITPKEALAGNSGFVIHTADMSMHSDGSPYELSLPNLAGDTSYTLLTVLEDEPA